jgi:NAD(P)-dependent dehydrogenase (short-subunit alcohol dehydrogenase family)
MVQSYALVTGANQGIGLEIARGLGKIGFIPILGCRDISKAKQAATTLATESNVTAEIVPLNVTSDESILAAQVAIEILCRDTGGSFDLLVNNAGIAPSPALPIREQYATTFDTNVASVAIMMDNFIPLLEKSQHPLGGHIINVGSTRGSLTLNAEDKLPPSRSFPYSASKAALNLLSLDYARNFKGRVRINTICPGHCATALNGYRGVKSVQDGAKVVLQIAVDPEIGTGGYYQLEGTEKYTHAPW